jgi:hypothetical protein
MLMLMETPTLIQTSLPGYCMRPAMPFVLQQMAGTVATQGLLKVSVPRRAGQHHPPDNSLMSSATASATAAGLAAYFLGLLNADTNMGMTPEDSLGVRVARLKDYMFQLAWARQDEFRAIYNGAPPDTEELGCPIVKRQAGPSASGVPSETCAPPSLSTTTISPSGITTAAPVYIGTFGGPGIPFFQTI